jgi:hypothetical protein
LCIIAIVRAVTAAPPGSARPATEADERAVFATIAQEEPAMRRKAAKNFPTDHWSQDDDFHHTELERAKELARARNIRLGDALQAIDDGMRERWTPAASAMTATVPPCQPRAIY